MNQSKLILVTGAHRSGSTWVGQVLAEAERMGYMHEPFNPIYPSVKSAPIEDWFLHICEENEGGYDQYFDKILRWDYQTMPRLAGVKTKFQLMMWIKYQRIFAKNKRLGNQVVMKDPIAFFSAPWLYQKFDCQVITLVRHPAAFTYSLKRKNWEFPFSHLQKQHTLMAQFPEELQKGINDFAAKRTDIIQQACLFWRILYHQLNVYKTKFPQWIHLSHEQLSMNPMVEFETLFQRLSLDFSPKVQQFIKDSTGDGNPSGTSGNEEQLRRNSAANIRYWKNKLTNDERNRIKELTADIWPLYYSESDW